MHFPILFTAAMLLSACSQSNEEQLREAAAQSDPAAAEVLNGAAENEMNPQDALQQAGNAAAASNADMVPPSAQARPNTAENPNPPRDGQAPEKIVANGQ